MHMIGSSTARWEGRPVIMIALQNGKRMAMLYVLSGGDAGDLKEGETRTVQKADHVVRMTRTAGHVRLLTTKGRPEDFDFQIPL